MRRSVTTLAAICLFTAGSVAGDPSEIDWLTDISRSTAIAEASGKPVMIDVWAIWCEPCKLMEKTTYRDERILRTMEDFVPLKVDADANEVFIERYEIDGYPTTLFLDAKGREITRLVSHVETEALLKTMEQVRDGYASYLDGVERKSDALAMQEVAEYMMQAGNAARAADLLRSAVKASEGETAERIELQLADALLVDDRAGAAVKLLKRLSTLAATKTVQGDALVALIRAERDRGKTAKADEALARLRAEFPDLVPQVSTGS